MNKKKEEKVELKEVANTGSNHKKIDRAAQSLEEGGKSSEEEILTTQQNSIGVHFPPEHNGRSFLEVMG